MGKTGFRYGRRRAVTRLQRPRGQFLSAIVLCCLKNVQDLDVSASWKQRVGNVS